MIRKVLFVLTYGKMSSGLTFLNSSVPDRKGIDWQVGGSVFLINSY
jgi:hypothetical protein